MKQVWDHYSKKAKKAGFAARSIYKLEEIDRSTKLIRPGQNILDLGCSPGSWMQYAADKTGPKGLVVGIDIKPIEINREKNMVFHLVSVSDLADSENHEIFDTRFHNVISDMAPKTSGIPDRDSLLSTDICRYAQAVAERCLMRGGNLLIKNFQGSETPQLITELREKYQKVRTIKPKSSRSESREIFILASGKL